VKYKKAQAPAYWSGNALGAELICVLILNGYTQNYIYSIQRIFMDGIDERKKQKIISLISALLPEAKIYLFGSRARGTHTELSDIDLALDAGERVSRRVINEIKDVLEATNIINSIDVVDLHGPISSAMRDMILKEGVLWKA
jgi:uncharacterized protein